MVRPNSVPAQCPPVLAPTPGGEAHGLSRHPPPPLLPVTLEEAASSLGTWVLPEHKEVALLIAAATQGLADYVVIGVGVIPRSRKQMYKSETPCPRQQGSCPRQCPGAEVASCPEGMMSRVLPGPLPPHALIESVQQLPHGRQVAVSDLLDHSNVIATQDLGTGPQWC